MTKRAAALVAAFLCVAMVAALPNAGAGDLGVSPSDFGIDPGVPAPLPPPPVAPGYDTVPVVVIPPAQVPGMPYQTAVAPIQPGITVGVAEPTGAFLPPAPVSVPVIPVPNAPIPVPGTDPLQAAAPDLYASLTATVTATTGDPSIPVVVRPATTAQATDMSGAAVNLAALAAQGNPVVDWNAAKAGTPYPVETPGQPGVMTYVVPIQVPVYVQSAPAVGGDPYATVPAVTFGGPSIAPTVTPAMPLQGISGPGGISYYGANPVSIASGFGPETTTGTEYLDFSATPEGAINLVTPGQVKQAIMRQTPMIILDVRSELVRDVEGHVIGDVGVPFEPRESFPARVAQVIPRTDLPVIVYCHDGIWASQAADALLKMGYKTFLMGAYRLWF